MGWFSIKAEEAKVGDKLIIKGKKRVINYVFRLKGKMFEPDQIQLSWDGPSDSDIYGLNFKFFKPDARIKRAWL